jgi:glycogen(starch) synthase
MRVILFSWEYPPRIVGKLAEYVSTLSSQLSKNRIDTTVVTYHDSMTGTEETNGVRVARAANPVRTHVSLLTWILTLNQEIERAAANVYYGTGKCIDLIDVFDWHFIPAAVTLKNALGIPFVYSVDSLEDHRSPATNSPLNMAIRGIEWLGFYEALKITAKSDWMLSEIVNIHRVPKEKIKVILPASENWLKDIIAVYDTVSSGGKSN